MNPKIKLDVTDPDVVLNRQMTAALLQFQIVDQQPHGPQRSGEYIHLSMTPAAAMNLMLLLQQAKKMMGWPDPDGSPQTISVPPAKDRN
ncbi:hypothetical protein SAMN05519103_00772 [Rhizobiales bacterium GAS113]|nr:hypothetical protein SAMN05519103_00772 [Rhizobiales bacterium GAS113]